MPLIASTSLVKHESVSNAIAPVTLQRIVDQKAKNSKNDSNSGSNNGNSGNNNKKAGNEKFPPCPTCKKTNHPEDRCFYKKIYEQAKAALAAEAKPSKTQTWGTSPDLSN